MFQSRSKVIASNDEQGAVVWGNESVRVCRESHGRAGTAGLCRLRQASTEAMEKIHPITCLCQ